MQGRIQGYMYSIKSEQDYQERIIPPSPERTSSPPVRSGWGPQPLSLIDSHASSISSAVHGTRPNPLTSAYQLGVSQTAPDMPSTFLACSTASSQ